MSKFKILGPTELSGEVRVSGSKNEALKLIPFSVLLKNKVVFNNVPKITDVIKQLEIYSLIGGKYAFEKGSLTLDPSGIKSFDIVSDKARQLRASLVYLGPLLAKFGKVRIPYPGGCKIGQRPIGTHTDAFKQLGAETKQVGDGLEITLNQVKKTKVSLAERSVTATENVIMYAAGIDDEIEIKNCATEPEISALLDVIESSGAKVMGRDTRNLKIKGSRELNLKEADVIADRIEAATFAIAFVATGGEGKITPFPKSQLESFTDVLESCGVKIEYQDGSAMVRKSTELKPFTIKTAPYPGFPTDLQSPMSLVAARASGTSEIEETMYENRLAYIDELKKIGLEAEVLSEHRVKIHGPAKFRPTRIRSLDLRSGITILIAGLMTKGETTIESAEIIDRGYENIEDKFAQLKANIKRIQ